MNDARTDRPSDVAQASVESAREKAVRRLSEHATGGSMTLDEYAERAVSIERAATSEELKAALVGLPEETAGVSPARRGRWLVSLAGLCVWWGGPAWPLAAEQPSTGCGRVWGRDAELADGATRSARVGDHGRRGSRRGWDHRPPRRADPAFRVLDVRRQGRQACRRSAASRLAARPRACFPDLWRRHGQGPHGEPQAARADQGTQE